MLLFKKGGKQYMNGLWAMVSAILAFGITFILGKWMIPFLHRIKYGQTILEIGPSWHKKKQGTPTMGGIMFIIGIIASILISVPLYYASSSMMGLKVMETPITSLKVFVGLGMAFFYGLVGFIDDYIKVVKKQNQGLSARQKLVMQFLIVSIYLFIIYVLESSHGSRDMTVIKLPIFGSVDFGILYWPIMAVIIVGIVNAVNLNDGIDGLCGSVTFFVGIFFMVIASMLGMYGFSIEAAAMAGGCLGFLMWNFNPAKVFMGDTGSLFLGGLICALGTGMKQYVILILMAAVYILEMFSVILQVAYFKFTKGKRLFKMSPIHHHFEMCGWSETKICFTFSLVTILCGIISLIMVASSR